MAANSTTSTGFLSFIAEDFKQSPGNYITVLVVLFVSVLLHRLSTPSLEAGEPPLLKPRFPIVGHFYGLMKYQNIYLKQLYDRYHRQIATLPILGGKLYVIFDPTIVQSAYRKKTLSFEPFAAEFAQRELLLSDRVQDKLKNTNLVPDFFAAIHPAMTGDHLHRMNANALNYISKDINNIGGQGNLEQANLWLWLRDLVTMATAEALYGSKNPLRQDHGLLDDVWTFEAGLNILLVNIFPAITAPKAHQARARLQAALGKYYGARSYDDKDASEIVRARAGAFVKYGVPDEEVGHIELALLHVGTANTIPTLYWFFVNVFNRPELVQRLREEVLTVIQKDGEDKAVVDVTVLDEKCPLLVSCYREAIRLSNQAVGNRRVLEDTTITDSKGNPYLLKKGENVQVSAAVSHSLDTWGKDVSTYKPDRFLENKANAETDKARRSAFIAFGGGRNLCPGRNFAFAENLGLVACLLAGFVVTLPDGPGFPASADCSFSQAAVKPVNDGEGFGVRIERRVEWQEIQWSFKS
ncbi:prostacyclin synthase [Fusarium sporotrichioides]|uniref:Prostacyclin synthase n=1 Tax=Fusarium sporotrichioides TaxID=5514 RepID=A0A395SRP6_FUSSP|nr:prostacyclin synthase [Fusarium sporotrichioides]